MNAFLNILKISINKFPRLALVCRTIRDAKQIVSEPKDTPLGFKFSGSKLMEEGKFEIKETNIVKEYLSSADVFINIGANVGYYCCIALANNVKTVAFEPLESNLKYLYANIRANNWGSNIEIFPIALSKEIGLLELYGGGTGASLVKGWAGTPDYYKRLVPVSTLDCVLSNRFENKKLFILVDVEGAELLMLKGADHIVHMNPKPVWMIEITVSAHQPEGITINPDLLTTFRLFWDAGYKAYTADENRRIIGYEEILAIANDGDNTLEVHNFLFIDKNVKIEHKEN